MNHDQMRPDPEEARRQLEAARSRRAEVEAQAGQLRWYREENGFGEQIWLAMGGNR